jgi:hypothetical protein
MIIGVTRLQYRLWTVHSQPGITIPPSMPHFLLPGGSPDRTVIRGRVGVCGEGAKERVDRGDQQWAPD